MFGPLASLDVPPGDIATSYGIFTAQSPLDFEFTGIAFTGRDDCKASTLFAADWDVKRYLRP